MNEFYNLFVLTIGKDFDGNSKCFWMYISQFKSIRTAIQFSRLYREKSGLPAETFRVDYLKDGNMIYTRTFEIMESGYLCNLHKRFYSEVL